MLQRGIHLQDFIPWAFPFTAFLMVCWAPSAPGGGGGGDGGRLSHSTCSSEDFTVPISTPELLTTSFFPAEGSHVLCCCLVPYLHHSSLLEGRFCFSCGFNLFTSHHVRHQSTIKHMNTSLVIYGLAWELRGFWMLLSGSASEINIIPSGFQLIALF